VKVKGYYGVGSSKIFKTDILKDLKGNITGELLITSENFSLEDGDPGFIPGNTYLIVPHKERESFFMSGCSYFVEAGDANFKRDSTFFSAFSNPDGFVDVGYFKGQLKNGKPHGVWLDGGDSGVYKNGKRSGEWKVYNEKYIYKRGKVIYSEEKYAGDSLIQYTRRLYTMLYKDKVIVKWKKYRKGDKIEKFENGELKTEVSFDSQDRVKRIKCYKNGILYSDSKFIPDDKNRCCPLELAFDPERYFYYEDKLCGRK
jgi:hypothetical protein